MIKLTNPNNLEQITHFLMLRTISEGKKTEDSLKSNLFKLWKKISKKHKNFALFYGSYSDCGSTKHYSERDVLNRYLSLGIIDSETKNGETYYVITSAGKKVISTNEYLLRDLNLN